MLGTYYKTVSRNEYNGDTTFLFSPSEPDTHVRDGLLLCSGKIGVYEKGLPLQVEGEWDGKCFAVSEVKIAEPGSGGNLFNFIFKDTSMKLSAKEEKELMALTNGSLLKYVSETGDCEEQIYKLLKNRQKTRRIIQKCQALASREDLLSLFQQLQIPLDRIETLMRKDITMKQIRQNPYLLCTVAEITIHQADIIADHFSRLGAYEPVRITGYVKDAFKENRNSGNSCCSVEDICQIANYRASGSAFPDMTFCPALINLVLHLDRNIASFSFKGKSYLYEKKVLEEEDEIIRNIVRLQTPKKEIVHRIRLPDIEKKMGLSYTEGQKRAFSLLHYSGVKILTGPPGSGKTAVIKGLISAYKEEHPKMRVKLAATTGRASIIMAEACGEKAETVHKMLDIRPFEGRVSSKGQNSPIQSEFIIVDEASMMGLELFYCLLKAVRTGSILLLVGDKDQLQSVEYGNVLDDMIRSGCIETYSLTEVIRGTGTICKNAWKANNGNIDFETDDSFHIYECLSEEEALKAFWQNYQFGASSQVVSSIKKELLGTEELNRMIMEKTGRHNQMMQYGPYTYYKGCRVIMDKTDYQAGYFNGEIGTIEEIEERELLINFSGRMLSIGCEDFCHIAPAYAVTIHKAQGSEFDHVHVFLPDCKKNMLTRRLLYTAVTRAKKKVYIYSIHNSLEYAASNIQERKRKSILADRIQENLKGEFYYGNIEQHY